MSDNDLLSGIDVASEIKGGMDIAFGKMAGSNDVAQGTTNHDANGKCIAYFTDINKMINSYSRSAIRDSEKLIKVANEFNTLDDTMKSQM